MELLNYEKIYLKKISYLSGYMLLYLPIITICSALTKTYENSLNSITLIVALFSIQCSLFYYELKKKEDIYLYILLYVNMLAEHCANWLLKSHNILFREYIILPFFIRAIFLIKIYKKSNISNVFKKNKKSVLVLVFLVSIIISILEGIACIDRIIGPIVVLMYIIVVILSYCLVIKIMVEAVKNRDFVNTIYSLSMMIMGVRLIVYFILDKNGVISNYFYYDKVLCLTSFFIPICGLFIEFKYVLLKNIKLNNEMKEMKKVDKLKSNFFANLAHELKTPVNIIFSCVQYLEVKKEDKIHFVHYYDKYNNSLKQNCYRMIRLINNIVDMTKINMGYFKVEFKNYDIVSVVENVTLSVVPYVENNNINIIFDTTVEEMIIKFCPECIERIMLNLLSNSIKYTNDNGNIQVFLDCDPDNVIIKVKDTGTGIPKDKQDNIFDVFVQGDVSLARQKEGSGIGLSIVKSLVELHEGHIYINKSSSKGTEMIIKIPNKRLDENEDTCESIEFKSNDLITKINIEFSDIYDIS